LRTVEISIIIINIAILIIISCKIKQYASINKDYLSIQRNMEELIEENSYISNLFLDNLDEKIKEGEKLIEQLAKNENLIKEKSMLNKYIETNDPITAEVYKLFKKGQSVIKIAKQLHMTQGEVDFRMNLGRTISAHGNKEKETSDG